MNGTGSKALWSVLVKALLPQLALASWILIKIQYCYQSINMFYKEFWVLYGLEIIFQESIICSNLPLLQQILLPLSWIELHRTGFLRESEHRLKHINILKHCESESLLSCTGVSRANQSCSLTQQGKMEFFNHCYRWRLLSMTPVYILRIILIIIIMNLFKESSNFTRVLI